MNDFPLLSAFLDQHRQLLLFATVFLEQIGLPVPAYPSLVVAGAIPSTIEGAGSFGKMLGLAVLACLAADIGWYWAGRRFGHVMTRLICQLSMSPQQCVLRSASFYLRYGPRTLLLAKFLPGASAMTTLLAGTNGTRMRKFIAYDAVGSAIWAGSALALGYAFEDSVVTTIALLKPYVLYGLLTFGVFAVFFIVVLWRRRRSRAVIVTLAPLMHISALPALQDAQGKH